MTKSVPSPDCQNASKQDIITTFLEKIGWEILVGKATPDKHDKQTLFWSVRADTYLKYISLTIQTPMHKEGTKIVINRKKEKHTNTNADNDDNNDKDNNDDNSKNTVTQ